MATKFRFNLRDEELVKKVLYYMHVPPSKLESLISGEVDEISDEFNMHKIKVYYDDESKTFTVEIELPNDMFVDESAIAELQLLITIYSLVFSYYYARSAIENQT